MNDKHKKFTGIVRGRITNINKRKELEERLEEKTRIDALTKLWNRSSIFGFIELLIRLCKIAHEK